MPFIEKARYITGDLIVNGTIEGDQVKAQTITANKFTGSVEEEYRAQTDNIQGASYGSYKTILEYDFPATEWDIPKGRHVNFTSEIQLYAGTTSTRAGSCFFYTEFNVPASAFALNAIEVPIAFAYHDSNPESYYQRVYMIGNKTNLIPNNMVMADPNNPTYRTYKNLRYQYDYELSELVTNGDLSTNTNGWTVANGTLSAGYYASLTGDGTTNKAQISQAVSVTAGEKYHLSFDLVGSNLFKVILSTSADVADEITNLTFSPTSSGNYVFDVELDVTEVYIILQNTQSGTYSTVFEDISLKQLQGRTYLDISAYPSNLISTSGSTILYSGQTGGASAGSWVTMATRTITLGNYNQYSAYHEVSLPAYFGIFNKDMKCRTRMRHLISSISYIKAYDVNLNLHSRIVEYL